MREQLRPVTISMFLPHAAERSRKTKVDLAHLMDDLCGRGKQRFYRGSNDCVELTEAMAQEINRSVFGLIKEQYTDKINPREFYIQQQRQAIGFVRGFGELLPEAAQVLELKNEISMLSDSPSDLFRLLCKPPGKIDPTLEHESLRHCLLSVISGKNNAMILNERSRTVLHRTLVHLNRTLFEGPEGTGHLIFLESIHDDETNKVVGFPDQGHKVPPTAHVKRIPISVRSIEGIGRVYISPRKKDDNRVIMKSLIAALGGDGVINTDPIRDRMGLMCVPLEAGVSIEEVADRSVAAVKSGPKRIKRVVKEDGVELNRGQSPEFRFNARRIIWFEDSVIPLEMVFEDRENYLNSQLEVGTRNPDTGLYMGRSHRLYELRGAVRVWSVVFPEEVYELDLDPYFVNRSKLTAQEQRASYKIA